MDLGAERQASVLKALTVKLHTVINNEFVHDAVGSPFVFNRWKLIAKLRLWKKCMSQACSDAEMTGRLEAKVDSEDAARSYVKTDCEPGASERHKRVVVDYNEIQSRVVNLGPF